jgi:hypothetical protein
MLALKNALLAGLLLLPGTLQDQAPPQRGRADLERLAWISGTWVAQEGERTTEEPLCRGRR